MRATSPTWIYTDGPIGLVADRSQQPRTRLTLHERLPVEVVQRIFILHAQDHGGVYLPFAKAGIPPQQAVSHACSAWRRLALETGELWNDIIISKLDERTLNIAETWLGRAGNMKVTLKLCLLGTTIQGLPHTLQTLCRSIRLRRLEMMLTSCQLAELSVIPDDALPYLEDTRVVLYAHKYTSSFQLQPFFTRVQYLFCASGPCLDLLSSGCSSLKNLRHLDIECVEMAPAQLIGVLSRATQLESCRVLWYWEWPGNEHSIPQKDVVLPNMKFFALEFHRQRRNSIVFEAISRSLVFPGLRKLALRYRGLTPSLISNISERFNFPRLEELELHKPDSVTVRDVLSFTPLLQKAVFSKHIVFDDDAMMELSTGNLGRHLTSIKTNYTCDARKMFTMVKSRQKLSNMAEPQNVDGNPRIAPFQYVDFRIPEHAENYAKDLETFRELDVDIVMNNYPQERVRQLQISDMDIPDVWSKFVRPPDVY